MVFLDMILDFNKKGNEFLERRISKKEGTRGEGREGKIRKREKKERKPFAHEQVHPERLNKRHICFVCRFPNIKKKKKKKKAI